MLALFSEPSGPSVVPYLNGWTAVALITDHWKQLFCCPQFLFFFFFVFIEKLLGMTEVNYDFYTNEGGNRGTPTCRSSCSRLSQYETAASRLCSTATTCFLDPFRHRLGQLPSSMVISIVIAFSLLYQVFFFFFFPPFLFFL